MKAIEFIGSKFQTPKDGTLNVIGIAGKKNEEIVFNVECSICSLDKNMFPDYFIMKRRDLKAGKIPCACSKNYSYGILNDPYLGTEIKTPKGGILKVEKVIGRNSSGPIYGISCSICSLDSELFPKLFNTSKGNLKNNQIPCACSPTKRWNQEQCVIRAKRRCDEIGYTFVGFPDGYKTNKSKMQYLCPKHGLQTCQFSNFINIGHGCPKCGKETGSSKLRNTNAVDLVKSRCDELGYYFVSFPDGYVNWKSIFEYMCPSHGLQTCQYNAFMSAKTKCPKCTGNRGFQKDEKATLYIVKWTNSNGDCWFKFGITGKENPEKRMKQQVSLHKRTMNEILTYEIRYMCSWDDGNIVYSLEREFVEIQNKYGTYCNKEMMCDGFTETITLESVKDLQEAIKNTTWVDVDLVNDVPYIQLA